MFDWLNLLAKDKDGNVVIIQKPNFPLLCWVVFTVANRFVENTKLSELLGFLSTGFILIWSVLEITQGRSIIRRIVGFVVLGFVVFGKIF